MNSQQTIEELFKSVVVEYLNGLSIGKALEETTKTNTIATYTTKQLAKILNLSGTQKVDQLRKAGAIKGIKKGNGYIFTSNEINAFLNDFNGLDISNEETIKTSVAIVKSRQKA